MSSTSARSLAHPGPAAITRQRDGSTRGSAAASAFRATWDQTTTYPGSTRRTATASASAAPIVDLREARSEALARYQAAVGG